jgi:hypothetical protein
VVESSVVVCAASPKDYPPRDDVVVRPEPVRRFGCNLSRADRAASPTKAIHEITRSLTK